MAAETKYYTLAEVAKHKTNNDVWLVIHNNVYDVTKFLNEVNYHLHTLPIVVGQTNEISWTNSPDNDDTATKLWIVVARYHYS